MGFVDQIWHKNIFIVIFITFILQGCCGIFTNCPSLKDRCAEEKIVAEDLEKQIILIKNKPELSIADVKFIISPLEPHFVLDNNLCHEYFEQLKKPALTVIQARNVDLEDKLVVICSQEIDPNNRDIISEVAIEDQRIAAKLALEYINRPTDVCITSK